MAVKKGGLGKGLDSLIQSSSSHQKAATRPEVKKEEKVVEKIVEKIVEKPVEQRIKLYNKDVKGKRVLLSKTFYYFGDNCPLIPTELQTICSSGRAYKYKKITEEQIKSFVSWLESNYSVGIHGDPCNWKEFKLPKLDIYDDGIE